MSIQAIKDTTLTDIKNAFGYKLHNDWNLNDTYRYYLSGFYIRKWTKDYFLSETKLTSFLNKEGHNDYKLTITHNGIAYDVIPYASRDLAELSQANAPSMVTISFRQTQVGSKYAPVALVKWW